MQGAFVSSVGSLARKERVKLLHAHSSAAYDNFAFTADQDVASNTNVACAIKSCTHTFTTVTCDIFSEKNGVVLALDGALEANDDHTQAKQALEMMTIVAERGNIKELDSEAACKCIDKLLGNHISNKLVCESGLMAVCSMSRFPENVVRFSQFGTFFRAVRAAQMHHADAIVAEWALRALRCFLTLRSNQAKLVAAGLCEIAAVLLDEHCEGNNKSLIECILRIICNYSDREVQDRFSTVGICETISYKLLAGHNLQSITVNEAVWTLRAVGAISQNNDRNKQTFAGFNIFQKMQHLVTIFGIENAVLASAYLHCIGSIAWPNKANQVLLTQEGVIEVAIRVLHQHMLNANVVEEAMRAIRAIGKNSPQNLELLFDTGVCEMVMVCMQKELDVPKESRHVLVLQWGWCAVAALSEHAGCLSMLYRLGVCNIAMLSLKESKNGANVAQFTLNALGFLCCSEEISRSISMEDIVVLSDAFEHHQACESCVEEWLYAIGSLCALPACKNRQSVQLTNIPSHIVVAMKLYNDRGLVSERACWCLCQLLQEAERPSGASLVSSVLSCGVSYILSNILTKHTNNDVIAEFGTKAIVLLCSTGQSSNLKKLYASNCLEAAVCVLNHYATKYFKRPNTNITSWALKAVRRLSTDIQHDQLIASNARITCLNQLKLQHSCAHESLTRLIFIALTGIILRERKMKIDETKNCSRSVVDALKCFTGSDMLIMTACAFVKAIIQCDGRHAEALGAGDLPQVLVDALICHKNSSSATANICSTFTALCSQCPHNASRFVHAGVCSPLLYILGDHLQVATSVSNVPLAIALSSAIATLLDSGPDQRKHQIAFGDLRAPLAVSRCLRTYIEIPSVMKSCCKALSLMSTANALIQALVHECNGIELVVSALDRHIKEEECAFYAIEAIAELCLSNTINAETAGEAACRLIVNAIQQHNACEPVHEASCRAIYALKPLNEIWGKSGASEAVLPILSSHSDSELVTRRVCQAIGSLAEFQSNKKLLGDCGACEALVHVLSFHMAKVDFWTLLQMKRAASEQIALYGADAMYHLACGSGEVELNHRQKFISGGALQVLAKALNLYGESSCVTKACLRAAVIIAEGTQNHAARLMGNLGMCSLAVDALHTFPANKHVVEWGMRLVAYLSICGSINVSWLAEAGACEAASMIILAHLDNAAVIGAGCDALCGLAMYETHATRLGQTGSCEAVVAVLNTHASDTDVAERACRAMANLARVKSNSNWLGPAGASGALIATYRANPTSESVVQSAWSAVSQICSSRENCYRMHLACEPLVHSLESLAHSSDVARAASFAISKLSKDGLSNNSQRLLKACVCEKIMAALSLHRDDQYTAFSLLRCVSILANGPDREQERDRLGKANGCEIIINVMKKFFADDGITRTGCLAIRAMTMSHHENQMAFYLAGGCETVCKSLVTFKASPTGALNSEAALWAMANLCAGNAEVISCLGSMHGACESTIDALQYHFITSPEVTLWGAKALGNLLCNRENCKLAALHDGAEVLAAAFLHVNDVKGNLIDALVNALVELIHDRIGAARLGQIPQALKQIVNILRFQCCNAHDGDEERDMAYTMQVRSLTLIRGLAASSRIIQVNLGTYGAVNAVLFSLQLAVSGLRRHSLDEKKLKDKGKRSKKSKSVLDASHSLKLLTEAALNTLGALCLACAENRVLAGTIAELETLVYISGCTSLQLNIQQLARYTLEILHTA